MQPSRFSGFVNSHRGRPIWNGTPICRYAGLAKSFMKSGEGDIRALHSCGRRRWAPEILVQRTWPRWGEVEQSQHREQSNGTDHQLGN